MAPFGIIKNTFFPQKPGRKDLSREINKALTSAKSSNKKTEADIVAINKLIKDYETNLENYKSVIATLSQKYPLLQDLLQKQKEAQSQQLDIYEKTLLKQKMVSEIQSLEKQASLLGNQLATDEEKIDKSLHVDGSRTLKEKAQLAFTTFKANQQIDRSRKQLMMLEKDMDRILFLSETSAIKESAEEISSTILGESEKILSSTELKAGVQDLLTKLESEVNKLEKIHTENLEEKQKVDENIKEMRAKILVFKERINKLPKV